jgi:hypothetical protein
MPDAPSRALRWHRRRLCASRVTIPTPIIEVTMNSAKPNPKASVDQAQSKAAAAKDRNALGPEHDELAKFIGSWDVSFTYWAKESAPSVSSTGRSVFTAIFDGRFIREDYVGLFMGRPFAGVGTLGFDTAAGQYVSSWFDNVGTGIMHSTAIAGLEGDDLTFEGVGLCPDTQEEQSIRHVLRWESDESFTVNFFKGDGEDEVQTMELVYTRRV